MACEAVAVEALSGEAVKAAFGPNDELWLPALKTLSGIIGIFYRDSSLRSLRVHRDAIPNDGNLHGEVLRRHERRPRAARLDMCSICHHVHAMGGAAMFTRRKKVVVGGERSRTSSVVI